MCRYTYYIYYIIKTTYASDIYALSYNTNDVGYMYIIIMKDTLIKMYYKTQT